MGIKNIDSLIKAREYAFLLLKFRMRSSYELAQRLKKKKFDEQVIKNTVDFLKEKGFIDDEIFAKSWIESRIRKPLGLRRLKQELKLKGVDEKIIDSRIQKVKQDYREDEEVLKLAKKRYDALKGLDPKKAKQRIYGFLLRRGFSSDVIIETLERMFN